jgi:hypothetical protein
VLRLRPDFAKDRGFTAFAARHRGLLQ